MIRVPNHTSPSGAPDLDSITAEGAGLNFSDPSQAIATENIDRANSKPPVDAGEQRHPSKTVQPQDGKDIVISMVRDIYQDAAENREEILDPSSAQGVASIEEKRKELYEMLEHLDETLAGKTLAEATAVFSSLLTIQNQLCIQKTEGITLVRTHLSNFFPSLAGRTNNPEMRQVVVLIFSPAEIHAIRARLTDLKDNNALKSFFTMILDQSFDVVQFNEMTGRLMLEMCNYFILQMEESGNEDTVESLRFRERYERSKQAFEKSIQELRDMESVIHRHLQERPVLEELPRLLRALLQIRLGTSTSLNPAKIISRISSLMNDYTRARMTVAFDFNRLPSFQHSLHLRHSNILNLQKELLEYSTEILKEDMETVQNELNRLLLEIEAGSETLKTNDPEYEEKVKIKSILMKKLEKYRRKINLIRCQEKMVKVQHRLIQESIKNYQKQTGYDQDLEEALKNRIKIGKDKINKSSGLTSDGTGNRMVSQKVKRPYDK